MGKVSRQGGGDGAAGAKRAVGAAKRPKKLRLDDLLVARGTFATRDEVLRAVIARTVRVDDVYVGSAAALVSPDADVFVKGRRAFVSRGGVKLQGALDAFGQSVAGLRCIDIGASTGGFTDCLLQAGAVSVACVDVNYGQLAWKLRQDGRVTAFERTNIRMADPVELGAPFDVLVADLSFIGLAGLAGTFAALCRPGSVLVALVKPQFESRPGETCGGVVTSGAVRERTVAEVCGALAQAGFAVDGGPSAVPLAAGGVVESSIKGPEGNVEYLVRAVFVGSGSSMCRCVGPEGGTPHVGSAAAAAGGRGAAAELAADDALRCETQEEGEC
ncbi:TlyA family RNA methyltransferase [Adlercreutzia aquisgranensis]|uniref:TlyA family RNA methyltransferase n=1 Tax=Adlercreutzia aquisgranensis TaxID=2941323 RepID=UPI00203AD9C4|nr:TlyA family RNA methyltransferase [Adlercreutzia aquisgranensis]